MTRVKVLKGVIYNDLFYSDGMVLEMKDVDAAYLEGTNRVAFTAEPLSPTPAPPTIPPKNDSKSTGEALATALASVLNPVLQGKANAVSQK